MTDIVEQSPDILYEADEHAWIEHQSAALRSGDRNSLDRANLIAYLTDMATRDRAPALAIARSESAAAMVTQGQFGGRVSAISGCLDRPMEASSKSARTMPDDRKQREVKWWEKFSKTRARQVWGEFMPARIWPASVT
ncbi:MAG TPA: DUF29 family protein [Rhodopila sp.]|nr:DUF29 family protein [Rhodopila sp.]